MNADEWHKLADERSAEIIRLDALNAELLEALSICMVFANKGETLPLAYKEDFNSLVAKARN